MQAPFFWPCPAHRILHDEAQESSCVRACVLRPCAALHAWTWRVQVVGAREEATRIEWHDGHCLVRAPVPTPAGKKDGKGKPGGKGKDAKDGKAAAHGPGKKAKRGAGAPDLEEWVDLGKEEEQVRCGGVGAGAGAAAAAYICWGGRWEGGEAALRAASPPTHSAAAVPCCGWRPAG